jgi:uncharacterized protein (DUF58 family)
VKPDKAFFIAALLWFLLGAVAFFVDALSLVWFLVGVTLLPVIIVDGLVLALLTDRLDATREVSASLALGEAARVRLTVRRSVAASDTSPKMLSRKFLPLYVSVFDRYPPSMTCDAFPATLDRGALKACGTLVFDYSVMPIERGAWSFEGIDFLLASPLRFWALNVRHPYESAGKTYPNFKKIRENALSDLRGLLEKTGLKEIRRRGEGMEFNSLRESQAGVSIKAVDWRATSRRGKVIIREYQEEQDQQVLLLLDSGYRLHRRGGSNAALPENALEFDNALNAALFLAFVALKHGDSVALASFGNAEKWVPPRKGLSSAFPLLMNQVYDLKSAPVPSSPFSALESALSRLHRRTFIILLSNFREEDGESLSWILPRVEKRHLLLLVSLREREAELLATRKPRTRDEALESAAAFSYLSSRRRLYRTWEHSGLLTLESTVEHLSSALINRYLEVKRSSRL